MGRTYRVRRKNRRDRKKKVKYFDRNGRKNRHHIINKCRGGDANKENILMMDINRHNAWHFLFKNGSFLDVVKLLIRCLRIKQHPEYSEAKEKFVNYLQEDKMCNLIVSSDKKKLIGCYNGGQNKCSTCIMYQSIKHCDTVSDFYQSNRKILQHLKENTNDNYLYL